MSESWRLSPERLYLDCWTRAFLQEHVEPAQCPTVCNVGIGIGEWDDWLGLWALGHGELVSVDIDEVVVRTFEERQRTERHPNPARVIHADLLQASLGPFDLVTVVGSTLHETHAPARALACAKAWVKPDGLLFATILHHMGDPHRLMRGIGRVRATATFTELPGAKFTAVLVRP
ncbi:MAG: class I SAM-dependent methyltransferase [Myxococcales bacterium]|nr:class I SAM-dependent methyltransferase [Myxococcales bacterium]